MPDPGAKDLNLRNDFPPVSTEAWEAAIRADLNGADYEKKLVWRTDEGISVRPYYRSENLPEIRVPLPPSAWAIFEQLAPGPNAIRADQLHESGANAVQELAYALAAGVERLAALSERQPVEFAARNIEFVFAVGSTYFIEIAKLRAARLLWAEAVAAFNPAGACPMRLIARTARFNKSVYDRYSNLLRSTTEAMSAVIGGCEELAVEPFGFNARLALNVQRVLKEEAHLDAVSDPAAGSYYIEGLTDALAREAWKLFQQVEAEGGYTHALESGSIGRALNHSRAARERAIALRRRTLVGVNNYPDLKEKHPSSSSQKTEDSPYPQFRLAEPFERIRRRTEQHARETGRYPLVLLLQRGDLKMRIARANFALNFFGCAGFDITESDRYEGVRADLIVLCSSDPEYLAFAKDVCPRVSIPVLVAGFPKDQLEALRAAGVQDFIHAQSDAVQTLSEWQDRLGMKE